MPRRNLFIYLSFFIATRLYYYAFIHHPWWDLDTLNYFFMHINGWVIFAHRMPLFIVVVEVLSRLTGTIFSVSVFQTICTLAVSLFYLRTSARFFPRRQWLDILFIILATCNSLFIFYEFAIVSESLFNSLFIALLALLQRAIYKNGKRDWLVTGVVILMLLLIKQAALFVFPSLAIMSLWLYSNGRLRSFWLLTVPILSGIFVFMCYNLLSLGVFTYSPYGGFNLVGTVIPYMETSEQFSDKMNDCLRTVRAAVPAQDSAIIFHSNDIVKLQEVYHAHYNDAHKLSACMINDHRGHWSQHPLVQHDKEYYAMSYRAIGCHPDLYFKFFTCMFWYYFKSISDVPNLYRMMDNCIIIQISAKPSLGFKTGEYGEYWIEQEYMSPYMGKDLEKSVGIYSLGKVHFLLIKVIDWFAFLQLWPIAQVMLLVFLGIRLFRDGYLCHQLLLFAFFSLANISNGIGTSMVEETFPRYALPYYFTYYLMLTALPYFFPLSKNNDVCVV